MNNNNDVKTTNKTMLPKLWDIIDELRKENDNLKGLNMEDKDLQDHYIATIRENKELKQANNELKNTIHELRKETK